MNEWMNEEMAFFETPRVTNHFRYRGAENGNVSSSGNIFSNAFGYAGADNETMSLSDNVYVR